MDAVTPSEGHKSQRTADRFLGAARVCVFGVVLNLFVVVRASESLSVSFPNNLYHLLAIPIGAILSLLFLHRFRVLGLCPPAILLLSISVLSAWFLDVWPFWALVVASFAGGVVIGAYLRYEWQATGVGLVSRTIPTGDWLALVVMAATLVGLQGYYPQLTAQTVRSSLSVFDLALLAFCWVRLFRPFFELCVEAVVWRGYRIAPRGSGLSEFPRQGPVLVIANHACWWDPLFLAKVLPRPITPMMTSAFYDRWFLRPLMVYVFQTIRVADVHIRREAPEIQEAIQALDQGKCVVIFPEGYLRRKEEIPLRRFGRGVWEILKSRPQTPVVAGWIEGGWGSYASYWNGPPTKNKKNEFRRPITVGLAPAQCVTPEILQHHLQTRLTLMNQVSQARLQLGLPPLPEFEWKANEEAEASSQSSES
ncbi:lysophospholipid acyltransferase family protein [Limnoglobus roseus]|uniref:1-acyl-sn-glycerol-3-phosphate acyltransferase n=1 Tax=Limnoglobus roseus TaxID=2598579 RepID=A0A5C1AGT8_9BACT|nr:lysophospholipid acyltransferase family protein [Limnoglobus roseus]QEL18040.1 1-acyl-sn-glycerol-3-phosphate acyltransferase [Limnoglobus roseus]